MRILVVEDDPQIGDGIQAGLAQEGHAVDWVCDGEEALAAIATAPYDLVVLDLGLPGLGGLDVLRGLRDARNGIPVLIVTARDAVRDRVAGLDAGADDYLIKPFDLGELKARVRALARRRVSDSAPILRHRGLVLDPAAHRVQLNGQTIALSPREFSVLRTLLENRGRVLSREQLEEVLYGWDEGVASNAVEVYVHHLRKKLGDDLISTVRGVGYTIPRDASES